MDLFNKIRRVHMVGIKGTGMSALAVNFKHMGIKVTGSDYTESFFTDALLKHQSIKVLSPFSPNNIPADTDLVVVSTAYNNKNVEVQEAKRRNLPLLTYPQALGLLTKRLPSIAICGSHGKTTTSGALGFLLSKTAYNPIINVGSIVPQLLAYKTYRPKLLVFEADEYQNKFEHFYPKIVLLTNIDYDHPDYFKTPAQYKLTFKNFVKRTPRDGLLIYCADDESCRDVAQHAKCKKIGYGFSKYANCRVENVAIKNTGMKFNLVSPQDTTGLAITLNRNIHLEVEPLSLLRGSTTKCPEIDHWPLTTKLLGNHNALNLTAAALCAAALGVSATQIKKSIADFSGTKRRLEITRRLHINGHSCIVIDDFGHHPTEIKATIATLKIAYPDKILWTVFQPHTFSRTEALFDDFVKCFYPIRSLARAKGASPKDLDEATSNGVNQSDKTIILNIYASKRETGGKIHSRDLVKKINSADVVYKPDIAAAVKFLKTKIKTPSIILTIGASEVWRLAKLL